MTKKRKANVCRNSRFQGNRTKNDTGLHLKNDKTNLFGYKLGELTENNKALLFFSWSLEAFQRVQIYNDVNVRTFIQ